MKNKWINREKMIKALKGLVEIPTVYSEDVLEGAPFGENLKKGLDYILGLADKLGFETKNYDGYMGEIILGKGEFQIGILCHSDVVEAGEGWNTDPFRLEIENERLYGRGTSDNKGPLIAALFAMKAIKEEKMLPEGISIKMLVGTNEEELWKDVPYYIEKTERIPDISIVPDAFFPVIHCEKGLYDFDLVWEKTSKSVIGDIRGGSSRNMVPARCNCKINDSRLEKEFEISTNGKAAHAMEPEKGINAISQMMIFLESIGNDDFVQAYNQSIGMDYTGERAGFQCEDDQSGKLTLNVGVIETDENQIKLSCNIRYPASKKFEEIESRVIDGFKANGFTVQYVDKLPPVFFDKESLLVKTLMKVYQEETGDTKTEPISMGGATYARAIPNAVGFGAIFPYEEEVAHQANEFMAVDSFIKSADIFYRALVALAEKKGEFTRMK